MLAKWRVIDFLEHGLPPSQGDLLLATLNGMVGDYLLKKNSRFAIPMVLTDQHQTLSDQTEKLKQQLPQATPRIVLCVHGWCMADKGWHRKGNDHGQQLVSAGYTPIYLRYNTGNHISLNGEEFAFRLEKLFQAWPCEIKELVIIGHSMGGLVTRSACHYADVNQLSWLSTLRTFITLGTPHNGAPLARFASWFDDQVLVTPQLKFLQKIGEIRSSGTKDLSLGFVLHQDWQQHDSQLHPETGKEPAPYDVQFHQRPRLPIGTECYAVATCLGKNLQEANNRRLGDGLVPVNSALGESKKGYMALNYKESHKWIGAGINHLDLLSDPQVSAKVKQWVLQHTV
ncbi:alpha/beta hydrolase [Photobacterium nomapromontoriensis]|uniref:PGAP1-like alpha/beta domain-containing protein n=1 Tax=Photobacterium nomapromontoriensis TaxID=2910237 RepID=UPI003D1353F7